MDGSERSDMARPTGTDGQAQNYFQNILQTNKTNNRQT